MASGSRGPSNAARPQRSAGPDPPETAWTDPDRRRSYAEITRGRSPTHSPPQRQQRGLSASSRVTEENVDREDPPPEKRTVSFSDDDHVPNVSERRDNGMDALRKELGGLTRALQKHQETTDARIEATRAEQRATREEMQVRHQELYGAVMATRGEVRAMRESQAADRAESERLRAESALLRDAVNHAVERSDRLYADLLKMQTDNDNWDAMLGQRLAQLGPSPPSSSQATETLQPVQATQPASKDTAMPEQTTTPEGSSGTQPTMVQASLVPTVDGQLMAAVTRQNALAPTSSKKTQGRRGVDQLLGAKGGISKPKRATDPLEGSEGPSHS